MNKKEKSSVIAAVISLVVLIGALTAIFKLISMPASCRTLNKLIDGCMDQSERKISACVDTSENTWYGFSLSNCVTVEDYFTACGIRFDFMSDESCTLKDIRIVGTSDIKDEDALEYIKKNSDYDVAHVFIAAEYTDKDNAEMSTVAGCYVISDKDSNKLLYIGSDSFPF